ncbi:hypothetical protein [Rhizobium rhizogenes]|uniref:hypothetical protein n=1 Tax=Rhizobium rhizogenes TaxID=359 RepID=UPI001403A823|nr:hypothetical protein [Rhizobium rhizogenes]
MLYATVTPTLLLRIRYGSNLVFNFVDVAGEHGQIEPCGIGLIVLVTGTPS